MSTLNYIDENGNINKAGVIPSNYIRKVDKLESYTYTIGSYARLTANTPVPFTAPADGYLVIYSTNPDTVVDITANANRSSQSIAAAKAWSSSQWDDVSVYMRKGMTVTISANGGNGNYRFIAFE